MNIDWSKAPVDAIGAFTRGHETFFVKTKESSEYMNSPGYCGIKCDYSEYHVFTEYWTWHERPSRWNGEGLPPVGTSCQGRLRNQLGEEDWFECTVLVHHRNLNHCAGVLSEDGMHLGWCSEFRPLRTPELIAAEERLHNVRNACTDISRTLDYLKGDIPGAAVARTVIEAMIDAGYRKQEQTK